MENNSSSRKNLDANTSSHKNLSAILQKLSSVGQTHVAQKMGIHESTISRMKDGEIEKISVFLSALGLKVVAEDMKVYPDDQIAALFTLLRGHMNRADNAEHFFLGAQEN